MVRLDDLNIKVKKDIKSFDFNNQKIEVKQYLPINDKKDLIQIALQKAEENGIYNEILLDVFFNLNIIYLYTNLEIPAGLREDEMDLYDKLCSSGLLDLVINNMDEDEYKYIYTNMSAAVKATLQYKNSAAAVLQSVIQDLPANAAAAAEIVENWDSDKFQNVKDMITMAQRSGANPSLPTTSQNNVVDFLEEQVKQEEKK